ncbi:MAG: alpha/beta hydrolase [Lachnospiraceae bacterium]|nr:alpha/beta hydrolase [Lachnospiraceae bacterium]
MEIKNTEKEFPIFAGVAPGSEGVEVEYFTSEELTGEGRPKYLVEGVTVPKLIPYIPENPDGRAVVIVPGGAFKRLVMNIEGEEIAEYFNSIGVTAFVLKTRLPYHNFSNAKDVILVDVQRAMRYVRFHAKDYGIDPAKIGVAGFSAGATSAIQVSCLWDKNVYEKTDAVDEVSARPDFLLCGYPVVSWEVEKEVFATKYKKEIPDHWTLALKDKNIHDIVRSDMPPVFIFETDTDTTTPPENSVELFTALRRAKVSSEMHIFADGTHGFGLGKFVPVAGEWVDLFTAWLDRVTKCLSQSEKTPSS